MQREDGGVFHKVSCYHFCGFINPQDEKDELVISPVSSTATADFAGCLAFASGFYKESDPAFAKSLMDAALKAEELREELLKEKADYTFETVLSTERNLNLLCRAKEEGYFIRGIYVLTSDPGVNVIRVKVRESLGGHGVPEEKIRSRYAKAIDLIPRFVEVCDILHIYDNTNTPFRIFKKRKDKYFHWGNKYWDYDGITQLTGISDYS